MIVTGVGYGVVKALDVLAEGPQAEGGPAMHDSTRLAVPANGLRSDEMEARLARIEKRLELLAKTGEHFVTRAELSAAMAQLSTSLDIDLERRLEVQNRSVQSLRTMVARTDELLEQVIENIESMSMTA